MTPCDIETEDTMSNPFGYQGKRVVVTGAATGVGAALLDVLAELGPEHVTVLDVKKPTGPLDEFLEVDLSSEAAVDDAIAAIAGPVHALFNNAGVADTSPPHTVIGVNYLALRRLSESLLERMPEGAAIVNTASTAGGQWASHVAEINEVLDIDGLGRNARLDRREPGRARRGAVLLLEGARAGVHDAFVAADDSAWRPHQLGLSLTDRHAAAEGLPRHDVRQADRLEHLRDERPSRHCDGSRDGPRVPRVRRGRVRQRRQPARRRRLHRRDDDRPSRLLGPRMNKLFDLTGKVAIVTGSTKGIGRAMAFGLAEAGATRRRQQPQARPVRQGRGRDRGQTGRETLGLACHVGDWDAIPGFVDAVVERFGTIDVLVNNAGITPSRLGPTDITLDVWRKIFSVNVEGPLRMAQCVAPVMRDHGGGSIVNIASMAAYSGGRLACARTAHRRPRSSTSPRASRRNGSAWNVRVNVLSPGPFLSEMVEGAERHGPGFKDMIAERHAHEADRRSRTRSSGRCSISRATRRRS